METKETATGTHLLPLIVILFAAVYLKGVAKEKVSERPDESTYTGFIIGE